MAAPATTSVDINLVNPEFSNYTVAILRGTDGEGSGIPVARKDGYIYVLTNAHVVEKPYLPPSMENPETPLTVSLGGETYEVSVVDISERDDMALLRFPDPGGSNLSIPAAAIGNPTVGEGLVAVGFSNFFLDESFRADPFSESLQVVDVKVEQVLTDEVGPADQIRNSGYQLLTNYPEGSDPFGPVIQGMSGGPLYRVEDGVPVLVGMNGLGTSSNLVPGLRGVLTVNGEGNNGRNVIELPEARSLHIPIARIEEYLGENGLSLRVENNSDSNLADNILPSQPPSAVPTVPTPNPLGETAEIGTTIQVTPPPAAAQSSGVQQGLTMDRLTSWTSLGASLGRQFLQNLGVSEGHALEARVNGVTEAIDGKLADAQSLLTMANRNRETLQSGERFPNMLQAGLGSLANDPTLNTLAGVAKLASESADYIPDASLRSAVRGLNGPGRLLDVLESLSNLEDSSVAAAIFASRAEGKDPDPILLTNELISNLREGINKYQSEGPSAAITYLVKSGTLHKFNNLANVLIERGDDYEVQLRPEAERPV